MKYQRDIKQIFFAKISKIIKSRFAGNNAKFATHVGMPYNSLVGILTRRNLPKVEQLNDMAIALNMRVDDLIQDDYDIGRDVARYVSTEWGQYETLQENFDTLNDTDKQLINDLMKILALRADDDMTLLIRDAIKIQIKNIPA